MLDTGRILLLPEKPDPERDSVAAAWSSLGGKVERLARFWAPRDFGDESVVVYGPQTFALVLAQVLGLRLVSPPEDFLLEIPASTLGRRVWREPLGRAESWDFPIFVKPLQEKQFKAAVYSGEAELKAETVGLDGEQDVMLSEVVDIVAEARAFIHRGAVLDLAIYEGAEEIGPARSFLESVLPEISLPQSAVLDLAKVSSGRWTILEANPSWGAGLNGCSAEKVLAAIEAATVPAGAERRENT